MDQQQAENNQQINLDHQEAENDQQIIRWREFEAISCLLVGLFMTSATTSFLFFHDAMRCYLRQNLLPLSLSTITGVTLISAVYKFYATSKAAKLCLYLSNCILTSFSFINVNSSNLKVSVLHTLLIVIGLIFTSFILPRRVTRLISKPFTGINFFLLVCSLYLSLFNSVKDEMTTPLEILTTYGSAVVYSGIFVCNIHKMLEKIPEIGAPFDGVFTASMLHGNIINILSRVVAISLREFYFFQSGQKFLDVHQYFPSLK